MTRSIFKLSFCLFLVSSGTAFAQEQNPAAGLAAAEVPQEQQDEDEKGIKVDQERISLDLKGIDIIELFRILSLKMGLTLVPTKNVTGRVNVFLNNLTFQDALEVILLSQDLACEKKGDIINVMTASEYEGLYGQKYNEKRKIKAIKLTYAKPATVFAALSQIKSDVGKLIVDESTGMIILIDVPDKLELLEKTAKDLDRPLETEVFDIDYAKAADLKAQLSGAITVGPGELLVDERSSKVVVTDLPEKMKKIRQIVKNFDEKNLQVFLEGEILQITLKKEYERGISWEKIFREKSWNDLAFKGNFTVAPSFTPSPGLGLADVMKISVGTLAQNNYNTALSFLETFGDTKILSRPKISVLNNQEAKMMVGSREAYVTSTQSQSGETLVTSENVQFIDVGIKLNVTPSINKKGFVTLKIKPEVSSVRETLTTDLGASIPIVDTSEAETAVTVKDGTMIMIAGLMKEDKRRDVTGVPFLSRLPVVGGLFGSRAALNKKTEVVVFITPHIITGDSVIPGTQAQERIPADILPEDLGDEFIGRKIEEIAPRPKELSDEEIVEQILREVEKEKGLAPGKQQDPADTLQKKLKGIKK